MTAMFDRLAGKGVAFLDRAGPNRVLGRHRTGLVALTQDGQAELWRHPLPRQDEGYVVADEQTIFWNAGGERWSAIALAATDGRQLYALEGEHARMLDGDCFLARNGAGTGSLRRTESGELIVALPGLNEGPYALAPNRHWLAAGDRTVQLWDLEAVSLRHSFQPGGNFYQLRFTPDSAGLVIATIMTPQSGMEDEVTQRTYDVSTGTLIDERSWWERQG